MITRIYVVNFSSSVSPEQLRTMCWASTCQIATDFAPAWGLAPVVVEARDSEEDLPKGSEYATIVIADNADDPDALGWHSEATDGEIIGRIGVAAILLAGGDILGPLSVSTVLSHEVLETLKNQYVNAWIDGPSIPEGSQYADEVCDPCEGDSYEVHVEGVGAAYVSNFVKPDWFNKEGEGPFDHMGTCPGPFRIASKGYMVVRVPGGNTHDVFGEKRAGGYGWRSKQRKAA